MPRRKPSVRRYHDRVAPVYDHSYSDAYWQWHDALTWDYLKPHLPRRAGSEVADLGCGTGKWAGRVRKSGYPVTCVDISVKMLEQARQRLGEDRVSYVEADLGRMSEVLAADRFALAVALGDPICCCASPREAMKQIARILAPGGVLVATFDNKLAAIDFHLEKKDMAGLQAFLRHGRTHWLTTRVEERFEVHTFTPAEVRKLAVSTGFEVVELIGKTVLPMRHHRALLEDGAERRRWAKLEKSLCRDPDAIGRASHLQLTARVLKEC